MSFGRISCTGCPRFPIELPSLAERREDIFASADAGFAMSRGRTGEMPEPILSEEAIHILEAYPWKGDTRELRRVMKQASILAQDAEVVDAEHLYFSGCEDHDGLASGGHS